MCYYSATAVKKVDAQEGQRLEVRQPHGVNWLMVSGCDRVACLKPGTELEMVRLPWLWRWKRKVRPGSRVLFTVTPAEHVLRRDSFSLSDGRRLALNELPEGLQLYVVAVPRVELHRKEDSGFESFESETEEMEQDLVLAGVN